MIRCKMANRRLARDVQTLQRHVHADFDGQVRVTEVDDNLNYISFDVEPNSGPYQGAKLNFKLFLAGYPTDAPQVVCLNRIYHPNIDPEMDVDENFSNICVSLLDEWTSTMSLDHVVMAVLFLLNYPQMDDPLSPLMDSSMSEEEFHENVRRSLRGEEVDGYTFPCLLIDSAKGDDNIIDSLDMPDNLKVKTDDIPVDRNVSSGKLGRFVSTEYNTGTLTERIVCDFPYDDGKSDEIKYPDKEYSKTCALEWIKGKTEPSDKWTSCFHEAQDLNLCEIC